METFFSNTNIKSTVKHYLLLKWNKYTGVARDEHVYLKGKKFVDTPSDFYLKLVSTIFYQNFIFHQMIVP